MKFRLAYSLIICMTLGVFIKPVYPQSAENASKTTDTSASIKATRAELNKICKEAQAIESQLVQLESELNAINKKEKMSLPAVAGTYEILSRYCTTLASLQRFSDLLILSKFESKSDFIHCSVLIKNFVDYFKNIGSKLGKNSEEILKIKNHKKALLEKYDKISKEYTDQCAKIEEMVRQLRSKTDENIIQSNVARHIATKAKSIEELDAELEAENVVGVLKNTKIRTELSLKLPAIGRIVADFGDQGEDGEMIYYLGIETRKGGIIASPAKGLVVFAGTFQNYENMVIISNGEYRVFLYGVKDMFVSTGEAVEIGDYIGRMDMSSKELPVVKLELKKSGEPLDPRHWIFQSIEKKVSK